MKFLFFLFLCMATCSETVFSATLMQNHIASVMTNLTILHKCNAFFVASKGLLEGGSKTLITPASCVFGTQNNYFVGVGDELLGQPQIYKVEKIMIHPNYTRGPDLHNIALLFLEKPVSDVVVYHLINSTDYNGLTGILRLWRYVGNHFQLTDNKVVHVTECYYERATNVPLRENEIAVMSDTPVTTGYFDVGTPFTVENLYGNVGDLKAGGNYVLGFLGKPRLESRARFYALNSLPYYLPWILSVI